VIIKTLFFKISVLLKTKSYSAMREKSAGFSNSFKIKKKLFNIIIEQIKNDAMIIFLHKKTGQWTRILFQVYSI
jgi:hypothetical protein